jgi:hypothetical protein
MTDKQPILRAKAFKALNLASGYVIVKDARAYVKRLEKELFKATATLEELRKRYREE